MSANSHGLPHSSLFGALGLVFSIEFARFPNSAATDRDAMSFGNFGQSQLSIDVNPIVSVPPDKNLAFLRFNSISSLRYCDANIVPIRISESVVNAFDACDWLEHKQLILHSTAAICNN